VLELVELLELELLELVVVDEVELVLVVDDDVSPGAVLLVVE